MRGAMNLGDGRIFISQQHGLLSSQLPESSDIDMVWILPVGPRKGWLSCCPSLQRGRRGNLGLKNANWRAHFFNEFKLLGGLRLVIVIIVCIIAGIRAVGLAPQDFCANNFFAFLEFWHFFFQIGSKEDRRMIIAPLSVGEVQLERIPPSLICSPNIHSKIITSLSSVIGETRSVEHHIHEDFFC